MNTAKKLGLNTHTPRDVPRCGALSLLQKPLHNRGNSAEFVSSLCVVGLGPVVARARVLIHEVSRAEEFAGSKSELCALCLSLNA
jgi:hypothetical protein